MAGIALCMRTIGLLGGLSWEASVEYEAVINRTVRARLGGSAAGDVWIRSYNFAAIQRLQEAGDWDALESWLASDGCVLAAAGSEVLGICANTMHLAYPALRAALDAAGHHGVEVVHVGDAAGAAAVTGGHTCVGLIGTRYTMQEPFLRDWLQQRHGLVVLTPEDRDQTHVHRIIYDELVRGVVRDGSRDLLLGVVDRLVARGVTAVVSACTELELLLDEEDLHDLAAGPVAWLPTAKLHALALAEAALA